MDKLFLVVLVTVASWLYLYVAAGIVTRGVLKQIDERKMSNG